MSRQSQKKKTETETLDIVHESVKLALDAADAAADVTTEFGKVRQENTVLLERVEKIARLCVILAVVAGGSVVSIIALAAIMYFNTTSTLEIMNKTNREALVIFAENVDNMNGNFEQLKKSSMQQDEVMRLTRETYDEIKKVNENQLAMAARLEKAFSTNRDEMVAAFTEVSDRFVANNKRLLSSQTKSQKKIDAALAAYKATKPIDAAALRVLNASLSEMQKTQRENSGQLITLNKISDAILRVMNQKSKQVTYP